MAPRSQDPRWWCLLATCSLFYGAACSETPSAVDDRPARPPSSVPVPDTFDWANLAPVPDPFDDTPAQPRRAHPYAAAVTGDATWALVTLRGSELEPGDEVVIIDTVAKRLTKRVKVGARPVAVAIHPSQEVAVVLSQLSPYASVIDLDTFEVTQRIEVGRYAERLVFNEDGSRMFVTNRATEALEQWRVQWSEGALTASRTSTVACGVNPGAVALAAGHVYAADAGGLAVRVFDAESLTAVAVIDMNAPVFDLQPMGRWVVAATLNDTNGLPCPSDADFPGTIGDGVFADTTDRTCSRGFADIQNEIAFIDTSSNAVTVRYTSDSAEVSEADREGDHPAELMKVVGSLPHAITVVGDTTAFVAMRASFELSQITVDGSGAIPLMESAGSWQTGFGPTDVATDRAGKIMVVPNMLGDTISVFETASGDRTDIALDEDAPPFPATDAEIGELFFSTSRYSTDGDQSCLSCHPDADTDGKSWGVNVVRAYGRRATLPAKNLRATLPLLIEGVFDENDFGLEMEAISFRPDFHDSSYAVQVRRRDDFYRSVSDELFGREVSFADMVRRVGDFLMVEPRLLPSPHDSETASVDRGRELFFRFEVGCAVCHPSPVFASSELFEGIISMGLYDRPQLSLDPDVSTKFLEHARDGLFNANSLRGLWDRRGTFFHDGRARTIRETMLTPSHPCLRLGERGFNEFDGVADSHGGISHLSCVQVDDLEAFLLTLD